MENEIVFFFNEAISLRGGPFDFLMGGGGGGVGLCKSQKKNIEHMLLVKKHFLQNS